MNEIKLTENRSINEKFYTLHHESGLDIYVIPKKHSTAFAVFGTRYGSADRTFQAGRRKRLADRARRRSALSGTQDV